MTLTEKLAFLRTKSGLTQADVAEKMDVSRQAVSRWELGDSLPSSENLRQLSRLYGVSVDYLMNDDAPEPESAVAAAETPTPEQRLRWRKPALIGIAIGLAIAAVIALLAAAFFAGYDQGVKDTTPTYPVHTDILDEADFEGTAELHPLPSGLVKTDVVEEGDVEGVFDLTPLPFADASNEESAEETPAQFSTAVSPGGLRKAGSDFSLEAWGSVAISASIYPTGAGVDFGLLGPDGTFYFINVTDGIMNDVITVPDAGEYTLAVRNNAENLVYVFGFTEY